MEDPREKLKQEHKEVKKVLEVLEESEEQFKKEMREIDRKGDIVTAIIFAGGVIPLIIYCAKDTSGWNAIFLWIVSSVFIACMAKILANILEGSKK